MQNIYIVALPEAKYFPEKWLQGNSRTRRQSEGDDDCFQGIIGVFFVVFLSPEPSHAHCPYGRPSFWGLSQTKSAAHAAERRREGGERQREERQRFVCRRYAASTTLNCSSAGSAFVQLSNNVGACAHRWVLTSEATGKNSRKLHFSCNAVFSRTVLNKKDT